MSFSKSQLDKLEFDIKKYIIDKVTSYDPSSLQSLSDICREEIQEKFRLPAKHYKHVNNIFQKLKRMGIIHKTRYFGHSWQPKFYRIIVENVGRLIDET